jgi:hypothetical protein
MLATASSLCPWPAGEGVLPCQRLAPWQPVIPLKLAPDGAAGDKLELRGGRRLRIPVAFEDGLRLCEESAEVPDMRPQEVSVARGILFKSTPEWRAAYADLKLSCRSRSQRHVLPFRKRLLVAMHPHLGGAAREQAGRRALVGARSR